MSWRVIFSNLIKGPQPASSTLDAMFTDVGGMIPIPCNASGLNNIVLTPMTNAPTLPAYGFMNLFSFIAPGSPSAALTIAFDSLGPLPVYVPSGLPAGVGSVTAGQPYQAMYYAGLNGGSGGFFLLQFGGSGTGGGVPPGFMAMYAGLTLPTGWLSCDGSAVSRNAYAPLFAAIGVFWGAGDGTTTFNLPDYRGYFWRGLDLGAGVDPGRTIATIQLDQLQDHQHKWGNTAGASAYSAGPSQSFGQGGGNTLTTDGVNAPGPFFPARAGTETRPLNKASPMIVKY